MLGYKIIIHVCSCGLNLGHLCAQSYLQVGLVLNELLGATVQQTHMRVTLLHRLTTQFHHQTQHAVGCRVLRPKVYSEV